MRRLAVVVVILVAAFAIVFVVRRGPTLPTSAVLAYQLKAGMAATYDVTLLVTNTVGSGATAVTSHTKVDVATHATVLRMDAAGAAIMRVSVDQPTVTVDGTVVPSPLRVTTAEMRLFPDGHVESVSFPGAARTIAIVRELGKKSGTMQRVGTATAQGGTDPLQSVLLLAQGSLPAMPGGTITVGQRWSRPTLINAPYMLLEQAIANSRLDGFQRENDVDLARIATDATAPVDLQTYQPAGAPLHVTGTESLHMLSYFSSGLGALIRATGRGHLDVTQTISAGSSTFKIGALTASTPPVHTTTDVSFTARYRQP